MVEKERNYGIDLLRNLSMLMIITVHILGEGGVLNGLQKDSLSFHLIWALEVLAFCGVNCFALISGYVSYGKAIKIENLLKLWVQVTFYSVTINVVVMIVTRAFSVTALVKSFFPVCFQVYWYFTAYVGLAAVSPLLQAGIERMSERQIKQTLLVIVIVFSVLPTLVHGDVFHTGNGYSAIWLIILFVVGGVMHRYDTFTLKGGVWMFGIGFLTAWGSHCVISMLFSSGAGYFILYSSPFILLEALGLLVVFSKLRLPELIKRFIAWCAPLSFGVYLIHTHPQVFKSLISGRFAPIATHGMLRMLLELFGAIVLIFGVCIVLDAIRKVLFRFLGIDGLCKRLACCGAENITSRGE